MEKGDRGMNKVSKFKERKHEGISVTGRENNSTRGIDEGEENTDT